VSDSSIGFDFSGITLGVEGLDSRLRARLTELWSAFATDPPVSPFLRSRIRHTGEFPTPTQAFAPKAMIADLRAERAVYSMPEGQAQVEIDGSVELRFGPAERDRDFYAILDLLRACLAWRLPSRSGAMLHAAALLLDGRAFLLVGSEGSGKSSWARLGEQAGGHVVSDDVVLLEVRGGVAELLGAPLFSTHPVQARRGRWPVAAILFPQKASEAEIVPISRLIARAKLTANLPFVAEALGRDPRIDGILERLVADVPCAGLRFALSDSFVELLRRWPRRGP